MTDTNSQIIQCPYCMAPIIVDKLGKYVNANPKTKKQAIEEELELGAICMIKTILEPFIKDG